MSSQGPGFGTDLQIAFCLAILSWMTGTFSSLRKTTCAVLYGNTGHRERISRPNSSVCANDPTSTPLLSDEKRAEKSSGDTLGDCGNQTKSILFTASYKVGWFDLLSLRILVCQTSA